jgi:hypothetical protein
LEINKAFGTIAYKPQNRWLGGSDFAIKKGNRWEKP